MSAPAKIKFPLSKHPNGQWYKGISGRRYYFGSVSDDPTGERAVRELDARLPGILAGTDHLRALADADEAKTTGNLLAHFIAQRRVDMKAGTLSGVTFAGYVAELSAFVEWIKPATPVAALLPEHFAAYVVHLIEKRELKSHARKCVMAYIKAMFRWGPNKGFPLPQFGTALKAPSVTPSAIRMEKARAGVTDHSERLLTGAEIDALCAISQPNMRAMILLGINCGLGPADIGRMRWRHLDLATGKLKYPRHKTGNRRVGYLWKRTREAINDLLHPKHCHPLRRTKAEFDKFGQDAFVFVTRKGQQYYRELPVVENNKIVGVKISNALCVTFGRTVAKLPGLEGITFYRLRHTFKTLGKRARDRDALNLAMGHKTNSVEEGYDHEQIPFKRVRRVALKVKGRLWPKPKIKPQTEASAPTPMRIVSDDGGEQPESQAA